MATSSCAGQQALDDLLSIVAAAENDFKLYDQLYEADAAADDLAAAEPAQDKGSDTEPSFSEDRTKAENNEIESPLELAAEDKLGDQCEVDEANWYRKAGASDEDKDVREDEDETLDNLLSSVEKGFEKIEDLREMADEAGDVDKDVSEDEEEDEHLHDDDVPEHVRKPAPWSVRPNKRGRSSNLTEEELAGLRHEQALAEHAGLSWEERGPDGPGRPEFWRGQKLREGKEGGKVRYSNRGGTKRELYAELARKGKLTPTKGGKGKGNSKSTKSGKGKGNSKSSKSGQL